MVRFCGAGKSEGQGVSSDEAEVNGWEFGGYLCGLWGVGGEGVPKLAWGVGGRWGSSGRFLEKPMGIRYT